MSNANNDDDQLPSRPAKDSMIEIIGFSFLAVFLVFAPGLFSGADVSLTGAFAYAPVAGTVALEHIGWGFGVYIPILLGFYAIVIGGQLVAGPTTAARTRRRLGLVAEAMVASIVPALVFILVACIDEPTKAGALLVIVPASAIMLFLAVQLGGFIAFDRAMRLASAKRSRDWAKRQLSTVQQRSRIPIWLVLIAHTVVGALAAVGVSATSPQLSAQMGALTFLFGMTTLFVGGACASGILLIRVSRDKASKVVACLMPISILIVALISVGTISIAFGTQVWLSLLMVLALVIASTVWPRKHAPRFVLDWSIQGAATTSAAKSIVTTYVRATRECRKLEVTLEAPGSPTLWDKIAAVVGAFGKVDDRQADRVE